MCTCARHDVEAAGWEHTRSETGMGGSGSMCTDPEAPTSPEVIAFWRELRDAGVYGPHRLYAY